MKKTYDESELKEIANSVFEQFPNCDKVFATTDGNTFLNKNRAELHAGPKGKVVTIERPIVAEKKEVKEYAINATKTVEKVKAATTLEELKQFTEDDRKTVIDAVEKKTAELTAAIEVKGAENVTDATKDVPDTNKSGATTDNQE